MICVNVLQSRVDQFEPLLCEIGPKVKARTVTILGRGTESIVVSAARPNDVRLRAMSERALRLVSLRIPHPYMPSPKNPEYLLCYVTETLECGHKLDFYPQSDPLIAKRRNCPECAGVQKRKPVRSVCASPRRKEAA